MFEVYEEDQQTVRGALFHRKHAWEPLHVGKRLKAAAKHLVKRAKK